MLPDGECVDVNGERCISGTIVGLAEKLDDVVVGVAPAIDLCDAFAEDSTVNLGSDDAPEIQDDIVAVVKRMFAD